MINTRKWIGTGVVIFVAGILAWVYRHQVSEVLAFLRNREAITAYLSPLGGWGPLIYVTILSAQVFTAVVPGHALLVAAGYVYGFGYGWLLNFAGEIVTSQVVFWLARRKGRPLVRRMVSASVLTRWEGRIDRQGFLFFLMCFWLPFIPSNAANYLAGLGAIPFRLFLAANLMGRIPGMTLATLIGSHGLELSMRQWLVVGLLGAMVLVGGRYLRGKIEKKFV